MRAVIFALLVVALYVFILAPLVVVIAISFNGGTVASLPIESWSLRWYAKTFQTKAFIASLWTSTWLSIAATTIATPLALAAALAIARKDFPGRSAIEAIVMAPILVPSIVIGIALLLSASLLEFHRAPVRLLVAHVLIALPYCMRTVHASLARLSQNLIDGAMTLGADRWQAFYYVTLPLVRPGILAGMIFAFLQSFGDVSVSLFLTDARNNTLPLTIMSFLEQYPDPTVAAMSSLVTLGCLGVAIFLERLAGLRRVME
jgi:putative spermidine/putrescine transport system permease protein